MEKHNVLMLLEGFMLSPGITLNIKYGNILFKNNNSTINPF